MTSEITGTATVAAGQAFGHDGAGGAIGVADPWHGLAYAWIPRRMTFPGGADRRGLALAKIVRACITAYTAQSGPAAPAAMSR